MRIVLPVAFLLAFASTAPAQERAGYEMPAERGAVSAEAGADVMRADDAKTGPRLEAAKVGIDTRYDERGTEDAALRQDPGTRSWLWIVLAVVVGGLIVVALT